MAVISPIHTGTLLGKQTRFFRIEGRMPFFAYDDLLQCLKLPRDLRRRFQRRIVNEWRDDVRTVATPDGICIIVPHAFAQAMMQIVATDKACPLPKNAETLYAVEAAAALEKITAHLPFGTDAWFGWMKQALAQA
jgi:hypothetical protein